MSLLHNDGYLPLGVAVNQQDEVKVDRLLLKDEDSVNAIDFYDRTPIQYAAQIGNCNIGRKLINAGSNIDRLDGYGVSALHIAACKGHDWFVKLLINMGCYRDPTSSDGISPIHCAAGNGRTDTVRTLLEAGVDVNVRGPGNRTPLYMAAECGHLDIVKALVDAKARLNIASDYGLTPLCTAVLNNKTDVAICLIKSGARVNKSDSKNNLPLHHAVRNGNISIVLELLKSDCDRNILTKNFESPIHIAVRMGHVGVLQALIQQGCDVNLCEPVGNVTPLHVAVNVHQDFVVFSKIFCQLLEGGCILNWRAFSTLETPLYRALELDKNDIAILLLAHGADPNLASPFDITALQKSCQRQKMNIAEMLLNCGIQWKRERWLKHFNQLQGEITNDSKVNDLLREWRFTTTSLQKTCRIALRHILGENLQCKVSQLPIPEKIQDFLMLSDLM
ncbi:ankyrin-3-like [Haliotis rufescens]|uniref:ankyrin-3-like n=1 Tax=Haliotis rufescens TaxID=6454 RepID=UPI001EB06974|nr:ankyrin-3-like [Haliotis rufescens]XP_048246743.1 ankyrin-3-like [Haliotis rufescens]